MTATAHALVGAAIASRIPDPATAIALAITSHFIMDTIPHWDMGTNWRDRSKRTTGILAIGETIFGFTIAYFLFQGNGISSVLLISTIIASLIPDWLETPWYIFFAHNNKNGPKKSAGIWEKLTYQIYKVENNFHSKAQLPLGLITQVVTVLFFLMLLK